MVLAMTVHPFFSILRFVPHLDREEFVNIGIVLPPSFTEWFLLSETKADEIVELFQLDRQRFFVELFGFQHRLLQE